MQLSSRPQFRFADAMTYIFWFLMLYLTTFASAQQPTEPNNNLQVLSVSIIDGIQLGKSSIRIEFRVDYQSRVFNLECTIEFPSLVGPPNEYVSTISSLPTSLFTPSTCIFVQSLTFIMSCMSFLPLESDYAVLSTLRMHTSLTDHHL